MGLFCDVATAATVSSEQWAVGSEHPHVRLAEQFHADTWICHQVHPDRANGRKCVMQQYNKHK